MSPRDDAWIRPDAKPPPAGVFLMAVDVVLAELTREEAENDKSLPSTGNKPREPDGNKPRGTNGDKPPRKAAR